MSNKQYLCILRSQSGGCEQPSASEMELMFDKYQQWQNKFSDIIVDMGNKLGEAGAVVRQEIVGGYMTLQTATLEEAVAVIP